MIVLRSDAELEKMYRAGQVVAKAHKAVAKAVAPGVTTMQLDDIVARIIAEEGAKPAFLGYQGFPASICTSVNEEVVHGIPGDRTLMEGDIISIDIGASVDGYYGDSAWTYAVGEISPDAQRLMQVTEQALYKGIDQAVAGKRLSDISNAIQLHAEAAGFSIVREFVGHGIGQQMHEAPQIPNFGPPGRGPRLRPGMGLAIEPMVNAGGPGVNILGDGWTVVTQDARLSAHFEHTVAITEDGPWILTEYDGE